MFQTDYHKHKHKQHMYILKLQFTTHELMLESFMMGSKNSLYFINQGRHLRKPNKGSKNE